MRLPTETEQEMIVKEFLYDNGSVHAEGPGQYPAYMHFYDTVICPSHSKGTMIPIDNPIFATHEDVCVEALKLKANPKQFRLDLISGLNVAGVSENDREEALRAVIRITFMLDCTSKHMYPEGFIVGDFMPKKWADGERFIDFVTNAFPTPLTHTSSQYDRIRSLRAQKKRLKAWKLCKRYKIMIRLTDDLTEHLLYNERTISIFHHTKWLKAHLHRSSAEAIDMGFDESLKLGTLPPQLILETLDSIQYLLFPVATDSRSAELLAKFVQEKSFDPDGKLVEGHVREVPDGFVYKYWGARLLRILEIADNPPPANNLIAWFERHTSERNALTVAILGLFLATLFGFLGLLVGIAQLVFSILQYNLALTALRDP